MAEMVIEASLQILIQNFLALATEEIGGILGVKKELKRLKESVELIQSVLHDAASRQVQEEAVKLWLKRLENVAYDADNLLDEFHYETLRRKVEIKNQMKRKVCFYFCFENPLSFRSKMAHKIKNLNAELERMYGQANTFGLVERVTNSPFIIPVAMETTSMSVEELVVGRENDVLRIIDMLVNSRDVHDISVFPIVGMGGLGKTTLARLIFNHPVTIEHFDERIWVCVSTNFEAKTIFNSILKSLGEKADKEEDLEAVTRRVHKLLRDKKYLLILDDLWNENSQDWESFESTLRGISSRKGNSIITTTRSQSVASLVTSQRLCFLDKLSDVECWSIIKKKSFLTQDVPPEFETVGKEIARKCGGVPLAANLIGATLRRKSRDHWEAILISGLSGSNIDVLQVLKVSYDRLPSLLLKKCFAYCAIFGKDSEFEKERLIQLWMAEGFLSGNDMESVGSNVYDTLLENSLLQEVVHDDYGNVKHSKMHDLVHDLAIFVSKEDCFNSENDAASHVRYLAVKSLGEESRKIVKENANYLRTLCLGCSLGNDLFRDLKRLHVLNLSGSEIEELSNSVGGLIHLRLLDVSDTRLSTLPDSICKLYNLQTLDVYHCKELRRLPDNAHQLLNMRHLVFSINAEIEIPSYIGKLTCLRTLPAFTVGLEEGQGIEELGPLRNLKGRLLIKKLGNVKDKEEGMRSDLIGKPNIQQLCLMWTKEEAYDSRSNNHEDVLEGLEPHPNIKGLQIWYFSGDKFPAWTMNMMVSDGRSLDKLVKIKLWDCRCEEIPTMGHLPFLKKLSLQLLANVKSIGPSFYNHQRDGENTGKTSSETLVIPFRALEKFKIIYMPDLVEWVAPAVELSATTSRTTASKVTGFPILKALTIAYVPKLKALPSHDLESLEDLSLAGDIDERLIVNMSCNNNLISLRNLEIRGCNISTHCIGKVMKNSQHHLEELIIIECNELSRLEFSDEVDAHNYLPPLRSLVIYGGGRLESIGFTSGQCRCLPSLKTLFVWNCPNLVSVALETPNLSTQLINNCPKWKEDTD